VHLVMGTLFLVTATRCAERQPDGLRRYGLSLGGFFADDEDDPRGAPRDRNVLVDALLTTWRAVPSFARELGVALGVCALVFPPFVLGFYYWHAPARGFAWLPQSDWGSYALTQVLVVGLPEEALFRGYLQCRLAEAFPGRMRWLGVQLSPAAWFMQAALFALLHFVVDYNPARLAVFFPALLFGWVAALRGGIGAAVLVHAACNLLSDLLVRGWL
jgi:membrane protease YdiL (CAAX protease family)